MIILSGIRFSIQSLWAKPTLNIFTLLAIFAYCYTVINKQMNEWMNEWIHCPLSYVWENEDDYLL